MTQQTADGDLQHTWCVYAFINEMKGRRDKKEDADELDMKKEGLNEEFARFQKLAGLIK